MAFTRYRVRQPADPFDANGVPAWTIERVAVSAIRNGTVYPAGGTPEPYSIDWQPTFDEAVSEVRSRLRGWYGQFRRDTARRERSYWEVLDAWGLARDEGDE